jgi:hypothetical protein
VAVKSANDDEIVCSTMFRIDADEGEVQGLVRQSLIELRMGCSPARCGCVSISRGPEWELYGGACSESSDRCKKTVVDVVKMDEVTGVLLTTQLSSPQAAPFLCSTAVVDVVGVSADLMSSCCWRWPRRGNEACS